MLSKDEVKPSVAGKKLEKAEQPTYPEEPEMVDTQFVRVNVRHITDGKGTSSAPSFIKCLYYTSRFNILEAVL